MCVHAMTFPTALKQGSHSCNAGYILASLITNGSSYAQLKGGPPSVPNAGAETTPGDVPAPPTNLLGRRLKQDAGGAVLPFAPPYEVS